MLIVASGMRQFSGGIWQCTNSCKSFVWDLYGECTNSCKLARIRASPLYGICMVSALHSWVNKPMIGTIADYCLYRSITTNGTAKHRSSDLDKSLLRRCQDVRTSGPDVIHIAYISGPLRGAATSKSICKIWREMEMSNEQRGLLRVLFCTSCGMLMKGLVIGITEGPREL